MKRKAYLLILLFVPLYFSCKKAYHKDWKFQVCSSIARSDQQPALDRLHDFKGEPKRATDSIFGTYLSETTVNDTVVNEYLFSKGQIKRVNTLIEGSKMSMRMEYDGNGNIKALESNPDGSKSEFTYDDAGRPASHSYSLAQGKTEKHGINTLRATTAFTFFMKAAVPKKSISPKPIPLWRWYVILKAKGSCFPARWNFTTRRAAWCKPITSARINSTCVQNTFLTTRAT
ncbi:RHS repeat protein [Chitinophaga sedimenti]|uniref:RHS repeat domain-containing protein n=1 Tax=Chitinophaga sedimenti TaxID=2033606 RepID=UPI002006175E|nr:RHS repeat domain-containing protein [Chitinophaga sedimenti]MCK7555903.1 RHS repeat protein [Chitinophaga sedimenti]